MIIGQVVGGRKDCRYERDNESGRGCNAHIGEVIRLAGDITEVLLLLDRRPCSYMNDRRNHGWYLQFKNIMRSTVLLVMKRRIETYEATRTT